MHIYSLIWWRQWWWFIHTFTPRISFFNFNFPSYYCKGHNFVACGQLVCALTSFFGYSLHAHRGEFFLWGHFAPVVLWASVFWLVNENSTCKQYQWLVIKLREGFWVNWFVIAITKIENMKFILYSREEGWWFHLKSKLKSTLCHGVIDSNI